MLAGGVDAVYDSICSPETIEIGIRRSPAETVKHVIYPVAESQKTDLLLALLDHVHYESVIVFCRTKHGADRIAHLLKRNNHAVAVLHSNRTQREREQALQGFRDGRFEVLVATDIAARGLDIDQLPHVVNFELPHVPEDYVHRIGRTGRAGREGEAVSLVCVDENHLLRDIERLLKRELPRVVIPGHEPDPSIRAEPILNGRGGAQRSAKPAAGGRHRPEAGAAKRRPMPDRTKSRQSHTRARSV